jgi:hypothetical protein
MTPDPWSAFLEWLTTVIVPAWGELIKLLPYALVFTVAGPILTLILLMWAWYLLKRRRGHVRRGPALPVPAPLGPDGLAEFPANAAYCDEHDLVFAGRARTCSVDGHPLRLRCPVDDTVREASIETCPACGTTYKLGAAAAMTILPADGPPEGGAAVA